MKEQIIKMYQEGKSISELNRLYSEYNYRQIRQIIIDAGLPIRGGRKKKTLSEEQLKYVTEKYCNEGEDLCILAQEIKWDKETLRNLIKELGLIKKTNNRINKHIISDYFSIIDSSDKAYILGLLFTDGNVSKMGNKSGRIRLQLQAQDKDILEKIKIILCIDSELIFDSRSNGCYSLEFSDEQIFNDLSKYNIIPNKTYEIQHIPTNIPHEFKRDFIRGLIDGDGSISFDTTKSKDVTINFTSYHQTIVQELRDLIDELICKKEHNKIYFTSAWHCSWRGYNQVLNILDILYKDSNLYITRKYELYQQLLHRN